MTDSELIEKIEEVLDNIDIERASETTIRSAIQYIDQLISEASDEEDEDDDDDDDDEEDEEGVEVEEEGEEVPWK